MNGVKNTPRDYSDEKIWVYFEVGSKEHARESLSKADFLNHEDIIEVEYGFNLLLANQQIPEIVRILDEDNNGIYQIVRLD